MAGRYRFNWHEVQGRDWRERYADEIVGYKLWMQIFEYPIESKEWFDAALERLQNGRFSAIDATPSKPCVFISHRQADYQEAIDAADILIRRGIDVWLDVEDPTLRRLSKRPNQRDPATRVLTALVIEMALINSSHVLAVLTRNTRGSMWVPYEYGRIKQGRAIDRKAAMLRIGRIVPPEYALLGPVLNSKSLLKFWP